MPEALAGAAPYPVAERTRGLAPTIDAVARVAPNTHRFLRRGWFAASLARYGGDDEASTISVVRACDGAALALPLAPIGPRWLRAAAVPGCYWPFRSFPLASDARDDELAAALTLLAADTRLLRIGPVYADDPAAARLRSVAEAAGWRVLSRHIATSYLLDIEAARGEGAWPRNSTLRKNRFHEKHLGEHGALEWRFVSGADWTPEIFDDLAVIEEKSWIAERTDGADAKFTRAGHGGFWRAATEDPELAEAMWAAILYVDGRPAAFSFDLNQGRTKYAIANSYDPVFAKHSPGKLLYYRNLMRGIEDGLTRVDWGAGDSGYKRVIGAEQGPEIVDLLFAAPGLPAVLAQVFGGIWRRSGN
ncbi:GNAT family N-acetyltransferase [Sphingomonas cavernae]|uniref:GNAT family N-acetyltransferase n=2 Tax=Sphingomonas cavernae TaxID=2320861 RepID=A0A418WSR1_9SPHN|nr:GNAT family N-acetyltransferase [Sphingomonas cavernae]